MRTRSILSMVSLFVCMLWFCSAADAADLVVSNFNLGLTRFDGETGEYLDDFLPIGANPGGFVRDIAHSLDGTTLFVVSESLPAIQRYDAATAAFIDDFIPGGFGRMTIGPNGNIFVVAATALGNQLQEYDSATGQLVGNFATSSQATHISALAFGPDGLLYAGADAPDQGSSANITKFDPSTGAFLGEFVAPGVGAFLGTEGMAFGSDGNLYVGNARFEVNPGNFHSGREILRYDGQTGAFLGVFANVFDDAGLQGLNDLQFGPSGNLFFATFDSDAMNSIVEYDALTGDFEGVFVDSSHLDRAFFMSFAVPEPGTGSLLLLSSGICLFWLLLARLAVKTKSTHRTATR